MKIIFNPFKEWTRIGDKLKWGDPALALLFNDIFVFQFLLILLLILNKFKKLTLKFPRNDKLKYYSRYSPNFLGIMRRK